MNSSHLNQLPIVLAISGASGSVYGFRLLQFLLENNYKVEFVLSNSALKVIHEELGIKLSLDPHILKEQIVTYLKEFHSLTSNLQPQSSILNPQFLNVWSYDDIAASISSGSYRTRGMIIMPCSMGTIGSIASGTSNNLITRAADVCLKERRKLVLVPREMPINTIHLENLYKLSSIGAIVAPASPAFYNKPKTLNDSIDFVVGKILDLLEIDHELFNRWRKESNKILACEII